MFNEDDDFVAGVGARATIMSLPLKCDVFRGVNEEWRYKLGLGQDWTIS